MAGLYVHIPFCNQACHYCDFHFSTSQRTRGKVMSAVYRELEQRSRELDGEPLQTVYLGGGTPSILRITEFQDLEAVLAANYTIQADGEFTMECNPEDFTIGRVEYWRYAGVNRLSIGLQSFTDRHLKSMNRIHDSEAAIRSVEMAQRGGFENVSIDLIYGIPDMTDDEWSTTLDQAIDLNVQHISSYHLTIEPKTVFDKWVKDGKMAVVQDDISEKQFHTMREKLLAAGFIHYEISNFAKPGFESQHNTSYWKGASYIGVGPSAHSFAGRKRRWNISNNIVYTKMIDDGDTYWKEELIDDATRANELIMTGLRTNIGLDLNRVKSLISQPSMGEIVALSTQWQQSGLAIIKDDHLILSPRGMLLADGLASDLFIIDQ